MLFAVIGLAGAYATIGLALQLGNGPGMVALTAVLALVFLAFGGWSAAGCLATTRPWWTLQVRGSVYADHRSFGRRPPPVTAPAREPAAHPANPPPTPRGRVGAIARKILCA